MYSENPSRGRMVIPKTDKMHLVGILWKMPKAMDEAIVSETEGPRAQVKILSRSKLISISPRKVMDGVNLPTPDASSRLQPYQDTI